MSKKDPKPEGKEGIHFHFHGDKDPADILRGFGFKPAQSREMPFRHVSLFREDNKPDPFAETRRTPHPDAAVNRAPPRPETPEKSFGAVVAEAEQKFEIEKNRRNDLDNRRVTAQQDLATTRRREFNLVDDQWTHEKLRGRMADVLFFGGATVLAVWFGYNVQLENVVITIASAGIIRGLAFCISGR